MKKLSRAMIQRLLPTAAIVRGTLTFRRSRILLDIRKVHGPEIWGYVHVEKDGYEWRCQQCGKGRHFSSGKRCGQCYYDNAVCKVLRPGPLGEVIATLLEGESAGEFMQTPTGWTLPPHRLPVSANEGS